MQDNEILVKNMSRADFAMLGVHHVAYVKKINEGGSSQFGVYTANGVEIALMDVDRDVAFATVRKHNIEPVSVH